MIKDTVDKISEEIEIAKKEFREKIAAIGRKFGFSETGIIVKNDAVISLAYEEIVEIANMCSKCNESHEQITQ